MLALVSASGRALSLQTSVAGATLHAAAAIVVPYHIVSTGHQQRLGVVRMQQVASDESSNSVAGIGSETVWFAPDANEAELKRRFRELAAELHPDRYGTDAPEDAVDRFQELSDEYRRLLSQCRSQEETDELRRAWMRVGGIAGAIATVVSEPALAATAAGALGSIMILSLVVDELTGGGKAATPPLLSAQELELEHSLPLLYVQLDEAVERAAYDQATKIKERIDAVMVNPPLRPSGQLTHFVSEADYTIPASVHAAHTQQSTRERAGKVQDGILRVLWTDMFRGVAAPTTRSSHHAISTSDLAAGLPVVARVIDDFREGWKIATGSSDLHRSHSARTNSLTGQNEATGDGLSAAAWQWEDHAHAQHTRHHALDPHAVQKKRQGQGARQRARRRARGQ